MPYVIETWDKIDHLRAHFFAAVVCGQAGHTKHTVWPLAVEQLKPELGKDMLLQFTLLGIEARDGPNEPDGELLVHVIIVQTRRAHQRTVLADNPVDAPEMFLYDTVALGDRIVVFHEMALLFICFSASGPRTGRSGPSPPSAFCGNKRLNYNWDCYSVGVCPSVPPCGSRNSGSCYNVFSVSSIRSSLLWVLGLNRTRW